MSCGDSISVTVGFKSHLFTLDCEESCVKHEQPLYGNTEKNVKEIFVEDLDSFSSEEEDSNGLMIKELGVSLSKTLHIHDPPEPLCVRNSQHQENICNQLEVNSHSLDTDVLEGLNKCATILCSELVHSYLANSDAEGLSPSENFSEAENLACEQRLPVSFS